MPSNCLISAAMIVKDEAEFLPGTLRRLRPFVDEIVVYDTGSTDGSQELARQLGATVIEGYWDDDFARARNAAADACSSPWILRIDADEQLIGLPDLARREIAAAPGPTCSFAVSIPAPGRTIAAAHLYLRGVVRWAGAVHEVLWPEPNIRPWLEGPPPILQGLAVRRRRGSTSPESLERNLRVALAAIERGDTTPFPGWLEMMCASTLYELRRPVEADKWMQTARDRFPAVRTGYMAGLIGTGMALCRAQIRTLSQSRPEPLSVLP